MTCKEVTEHNQLTLSRLLLWRRQWHPTPAASPGGKGGGLDANSGSTEERMKDLAQGAWTGRKGWVVSEPCPEDLGIWQMQEGRTFQKEGTAL